MLDMPMATRSSCAMARRPLSGNIIQPKFWGIQHEPLRAPAARTPPRSTFVGPIGSTMPHMQLDSLSGAGASLISDLRPVPHTLLHPFTAGAKAGACTGACTACKPLCNHTVLVRSTSTRPFLLGMGIAAICHTSSACHVPWH